MLEIQHKKLIIMYKGRDIDINTSMLQALKKMDDINKKLLLVFKKRKFVSLLSIGDIQRAIIKGIDLDTNIESILRDNIRLAKESDSLDDIKAKMLKWRSECMPVINEQEELVKVYFWEDLFGHETKRIISSLDLPVVIMAGGMGTRLKPITNVLPKPLIPIGEKTIVEEIMDRFINVGCNEFLFSVNYKADMIKYYFDTTKNYNISYFQEEKPLGTVGSLFLMKEKIHSTFFVSNCDIIIDADYSEILKYHRDNNNELTIVSALKHYSIPYGIINTNKMGVLSNLKEKPELTFQINSGMYVLEQHLIKEIPDNSFFHITELIEKIQHRNGKVGVFPISEKSWKDIGTWSEYISQITM